MFFKLRVLQAAVLLSTGLICTAVHAAEDSITNHQGDITPMCGTKPMVVGVSDGYGGNTWRKTGLAEVKDELSRCKNVTRVIYSNANGDPQKANSDINSMVAQGINVLILLPDFGAVQLPAMRAAMKAGVAVVPYSAQMDGVPGRDYVVNVVGNTKQIGVLWADWLGTTLKKGNVVFMGGSPGATTSQNFMDGLRGGLKKYPDLKLLNEQYIVTNWNPVDAQKATVGLIAQYPKIDAIVTDGGLTALAAVKAFEQAHLPVPAIATIASDNQVNCHFLAAKQLGQAISLLHARRHDDLRALCGTPGRCCLSRNRQQGISFDPSVPVCGQRKGARPEVRPRGTAGCRPHFRAPAGKAEGRVRALTADDEPLAAFEFVQESRLTRCYLKSSDFRRNHET